MKNIGPIVLTENEKLLINSGLSMVGGVIVGTVQGTYQYLITPGGHVTVGSAVTFAVGGFVALLGIALRAYVPAHAQQMLADAQARATELEQALHLATTSQPVVVAPAQPTPVAAPQSPVTIHFNGVVPTLSTVTGITPIETSGGTIALPPTATVTAGASTILANTVNLPGTAVQPATVQLTMSPAAPTIATTPDLSSEDTAVRKSVTIVS